MRRYPTLLALLALVSLVTASCGETLDTGFPPETPKPSESEAGHGGGENGGENGAEPVETDRIEIVDSDYVPKIAQVAAGTTVTWFQTGTLPHTVTFDDESFDSSPDCPQQNDDCTQEGDEVTYEFKEAGEYPYYCKLHGTPGGVGMAGTVIVE